MASLGSRCATALSQLPSWPAVVAASCGGTDTNSTSNMGEFVALVSGSGPYLWGNISLPLSLSQIHTSETHACPAASSSLGTATKVSSAQPNLAHPRP